MGKLYLIGRMYGTLDREVKKTRKDFIDAFCKYEAQLKKRKIIDDNE